LAAAYDAGQGTRGRHAVEYTLMRSRGGWAARWLRKVVNGAVLERGPIFLTEKPGRSELAVSWGWAPSCFLKPTGRRKTYILVHNRLEALPRAHVSVPTKPVPTALTRLFSFFDQGPMALELLHPPRPSGLPDDRLSRRWSAPFLRSRGGHRLADPLLSASMAATLPSWCPHRSAPPRREEKPNTARSRRHVGGSPPDARPAANSSKDSNRGAAPGHLTAAARRNAAVW